MISGASGSQPGLSQALEYRRPGDALAVGGGADSAGPSPL